ncbi:3-dehydroquinate dehydratase [Flavobacteriales bacterium]|jgi:3-dehydroquinate dehydratase-2|nr:3-dehydroquinate dehydratase [Flavobacteriales bacterium]MDC3394781.1 3-dehydroquinate dehydratase [Flavobacteriales bacterium]
MKVMIINGPNLNLLGKREEAIYGNITFDDFLKDLQVEFTDLNLKYFQSNIEGELINKLQEVGFTFDYILLNAGGYTHTSVALTDCVKAIETPVIEVHISNIYAREDFRKKSLLSPNCKAVISGLGLDSYKAGLSVL